MAEDRYHRDRIGNRKLKPETLMLGYGTIRSFRRARSSRRCS